MSIQRSTNSISFVWTQFYKHEYNTSILSDICLNSYCHRLLTIREDRYNINMQCVLSLIFSRIFIVNNTVYGTPEQHYKLEDAFFENTSQNTFFENRSREFQSLLPRILKDEANQLVQQLIHGINYMINLDTYRSSSEIFSS